MEIEDFTVDFTKVGKTTIGWKADLILDEWITADEDGLHLNNPEIVDPWYGYQLWIFSGANLEVETEYTVKIVAKVSEGSANVRCRIGDWGGGIAGNIEVNSTEYQEYTFSGPATTASNGLLVQFGDYAGTVSFKTVTITHEGKAERPVTWLELLTDDGTPEGKYVGDAETPWPAWSLETDGGININWRTDRAPEICAWSLTMGKNNDEGPSDLVTDNRARPYPADIEEEAGNASNHVFAVHVEQIDKIDDDASIAWSNQFWIQGPKGLKEGASVKVKFRYKAEHACSTGTQFHQKYPSIYNIWNAAGDVSFTTEWQEFDKTLTVHTNGTDDTYSLCFNLNSDEANGRTPNVFYFDDLSWQVMKLDEGLFVASSNAANGIEYDLGNAIEFQKFDDLYSATVGTLGDESSWVNEVMISTVRGHDGSFKGATIKPQGTVVNDPDTWLDYTSVSNAKIKLPAAGVWTISVDMEGKQINFIQLEGETPKDPVDIATNPTEIIINGVERDDIKSDDFPEGTGNAWDNQFFIVANRALDEGEVTVIKFSYMASKDDVKVTTQDHGEPGAYLHWAALGDLNFTGSWQDYTKEFTVPKEANGMKSFAFNMAEIKEACDYTVKDVQWYLKDDYNESGKTLENLIDATGSKNFYVKIGAGTDPYIYGTDPAGINGIVTKNNNESNAIFNVAGQKVDKNYKGLVIKNGKKMIQD